MMPDRMRYGRTPDAICLLGLLGLVGALMTILGKTPGSVDAIVPAVIGLIWSATFSLASFMALAGILWKDPLTGWNLELTGRIGLAFTAGAYAVVLFGVVGNWGSAIVIAMVAAVSASSAWRVIQLLRKMDDFRTAVIDQRRPQKRGRR